MPPNSKIIILELPSMRPSLPEIKKREEEPESRLLKALQMQNETHHRELIEVLQDMSIRMPLTSHSGGG